MSEIPLRRSAVRRQRGIGKLIGSCGRYDSILEYEAKVCLAVDHDDADEER